MKRCFCIALTLALLTTALFPTFAEEAEIVSEAVDAVVAPAELAGDTGLTVEGESPAREQTPEEAVEESPAAPSPSDPPADPAAEAVAQEISAEPLAGDAADAGEDAFPAEDGFEVAAAPALTGLQLSASTLSIGLKEKYAGLKVSALPEGSALPAVTWSSSNKRYVKVNASTGQITGVKRGSAYVYAKTKNGKYKVKCKVTVKKNPSKISATPASLTLSVGMTARPGVALPKGSASAKLTYSSSKPKCAAVSEDGTVTALKKGSATITIAAYNGKKAKCKVVVKAAPDAVAFPDSIISVAVNQSVPLNASALTSSGEATPAAVTCAVDPASSDADCVALDPEKGTIKGLRKGSAIVTATTHNGIVGRCEVLVAAAPKSVALNAATVRLGVKEVYTGLKAEVTPPDGEETCATAVTWSSDNKKVAVVDRHTGAITGIRKGSCTITVKTANKKKATCKVKVLKAPSKITIKPANGVLRVGKTGQYKITLPKGSGGTVTYQSSDPDVATVDADGLVTAVAAGSCTITATAYNGKSAKAALTVNSDASSTEQEGGKAGTNAEKIEYLIGVAMTQLGKPYVYAGGYYDKEPRGFDCSGFTFWCYMHLDIKLRDSAYRQGYDDSQPKIELSKLKKGDLVFFNTNEKDGDLSDHAGLYLGGSRFIHASSSARKVIVSSLASGYYNRTFSWGRRVLN